MALFLSSVWTLVLTRSLTPAFTHSFSLVTPEPLLLLTRPSMQEESRPLYGPMNCTPLSVTSKPLATEAKISSFIHPAANELPCVPLRLVVHATVMNSTLAWRDILVAPSPLLAPGDSAPAYKARMTGCRLLALLAPRFNPYQTRSKTLCLSTNGK